MKVFVSFYKESGKWYADGEVDIEDAKLWRDEQVTTTFGDTHEQVTCTYNQVAVAIGANQEILNKGAITRSRFFVVVRNIDPWDPKTDFCNCLFRPEDFPPGS
jgi:hypothetical protein